MLNALPIFLVIGLAFQDSTGNAVYPLSPVAALFINTIAAGPPALALGLEPTAWDAMFKSPEAYRTIFTRWWWMDLFFYGILIGALGVISFVIPVWASDLNGGIGVQGLNCNDVGYDASQCKNIYHGRATCYATVMLLLMLHSLECKSAEYSIFQMNLLDNKVLLWSAGICALTTFPILYIPCVLSSSSFRWPTESLTLSAFQCHLRLRLPAGRHRIRVVSFAALVRLPHQSAGLTLHLSLVI